MKLALALLFTTSACSFDGGADQAPDASVGDDTHRHKDAAVPHVDASATPPASARTVFVIPLENEPSSSIYGNSTGAPYINSLLATAAHATNFQDELPALESEPHYIWMEAGTNAFADHTFTTDGNATAANSTASTDHLVTQLEAAGIPWRSYQQSMAAGTCPTTSTGDFAAKHDPFVFFRDVSGATPSKTAARCVAHHRPYTAFGADLAAGLAGYVFITPDLCHDMHGATTCPQGTAVPGNIKAGDAWLAAELPAMIAYTQTHDAVIFLTWDEGDSSNLIPFIAIGAHIKAGAAATAYTHGSLLKTVEEFLGVPVLPSVTTANDLADMFTVPLT